MRGERPNVRYRLHNFKLGQVQCKRGIAAALPGRVGGLAGCDRLDVGAVRALLWPRRPRRQLHQGLEGLEEAMASSAMATSELFRGHMEAYPWPDMPHILPHIDPLFETRIFKCIFVHIEGSAAYATARERICTGIYLSLIHI